MNTDQFRRWLEKQGIVVKARKGKGGHVFLYNPANGRTSTLSTGGGRKQLGTGYMAKVKKDLGL